MQGLQRFGEPWEVEAATSLGTRIAAMNRKKAPAAAPPLTFRQKAITASALSLPMVLGRVGGAEAAASL
jgi:hypothetical protein